MFAVRFDGRVATIGVGGRAQSLHDGLWIAGRLRLDDRAGLAARLGLDPHHRSDGGLCLHAYAAWGEAFLDRLAGDFGFVLWDRDAGRLIAARDQLGVQPLFYARAGDGWLVSDSLAWIAAQPGVDLDLDERWIADLLTAGFSRQVDRTVHRGVHRLAPAHVLRLSPQGPTLRRYWTLAIGDPLYLKSGRAYAERLDALMAAAIGDRLPATGRVGISMSGGLDSTSLAAWTVAAAGDASRVVAECVHYERLMADDEPAFATAVAKKLGIELWLRPADDLAYDPQWRERGIRTAEPTTAIVTAHVDRLVRQDMAAMSGVWFYGEGPDNALQFERAPYLAWLRRQRRWGRLAQALLLYLGAKGTDDWGTTVGRYLRRPQPIDDAVVPPPWLARDLVERVPAPEDEAADAAHPWHPRALRSFGDPVWQRLFASLGAEHLGDGLVWRHPYLDLRVLGFLLSVPPVPWARGKLVLRRAMRNRLPAAVLDRKKMPLAKDPVAEAVQQSGLPALAVPERLRPYVDVTRLPQGPADDRQLDALLAVHALDHWLAGR